MSQQAREGVGASHDGGDADGSAAHLRPELERLCRRLLRGTASAGRAAALERALAGLGELPPAERRSAGLAAAARACVELAGAKGALAFEAADLDPADLDGEGPAPLGAAAGSLTRQRLDGALDALPRRQATLLVLRYQAELGYPELAPLLGVGRDQLGVLLYRARRALREALAKGTR